MRFLLTLLLSAAACGPAPVSPPLSVTAGLNDYVWSFEQAWGQQVTGVDVRFATDLPQEWGSGLRTIGLCSPYFDYWQVLIDEEWWQGASPECREVLMFHELSHCALGRDHNNALHDDGRPVSVMYHTVLPCEWWGEYRAEYVRELFGKETP